MVAFDLEQIPAKAGPRAPEVPPKSFPSRELAPGRNDTWKTLVNKGGSRHASAPTPKRRAHSPKMYLLLCPIEPSTNLHLKTNCYTRSHAFENGVRKFYFASFLMASVSTLALPEITVATPHPEQPAWTLPSNSPNNMPCVRCSSTEMLWRQGVQGFSRLLLAP